MLQLRSAECTAAALESVGRLVTPEAGQPPASGQEFSFAVVAEDLGLGGSLCAGRLECASRPMRVLRMERHLRTPELLSVSAGDCVIVLAPPQEPGRDAGGRLVLAGLKAVTLREGQTVVLDTGAWHWIPFPLGKQSSRLLVVFRNKTGADDLHFCDFEEAVEVLAPAIGGRA